MTSNYARRMTRLSARIFGEVWRPTTQENMKVVEAMSAKPLEQRPEMTQWYPLHSDMTWLMRKLRWLGLYR